MPTRAKPKADLCLQDAYKLDRHHAAIDDKASCAICAEQFEVGQWVIMVSMGMMGRHKMVADAHLGCAINGGEVNVERAQDEGSALRTIARWDSSVAEQNGNVGVIEYAQRALRS